MEKKSERRESLRLRQRRYGKRTTNKTEKKSRRLSQAHNIARIDPTVLSINPTKKLKKTTESLEGIELLFRSRPPRFWGSSLIGRTALEMKK